MTLTEKYNKWLEVFEKYFIVEGDAKTISGLNIPLSQVSFVDGEALQSIVGDGTINIAGYLNFLFSNLIGAKDSISYEKYTDKILNTLKTIERLEEAAYLSFIEKYNIQGTNLPFSVVKGFFLRDDIRDKDKSMFNTQKIISSYSRCIELIDEDPCHSPYTSQDQIWNLLPILSILSKFAGGNIAVLAREKAGDMLNYVIDHNHKIYNPFYSTLYHFWTYLPTFDESRVKPWDRIKDRTKKLKYKIKVKRGANNWYFGFGFRKAYENITNNKLPKFKNFLYGLWYRPFIFLADRIYYPIFGNIVPRKETSYYSLGLAGNVWYGPGYDKRLIDRFNYTLKKWSQDKKTELFMPELVFLSDKRDKINYDLLETWLNEYPEPELSGTVNSPLTFLMLYRWNQNKKEDIYDRDINKTNS